MFVSWVLSEWKLPVIGSSFELSPESLNTLKSGNTQQLDELNKLQRGIFMDLGHIEGHQVVQSLNNLEVKINVSLICLCCYTIDSVQICLKEGSLS